MNKDVLILSFGRVTQIGLSLVSVKVFTSVLVPNEVGKYYFIFTLISFFSQALINPVGMYLNRHLHKWVQNGKILNHIFLFCMYLLLLSFAALIVVTVLHQYFGVGTSLNLLFLNSSVALIVFFLTLNQTVLGSLNMLNHRISFVTYSILTQVITLVLSVAFVKFFSPTAFAWILGQIVAVILVSSCSMLYFGKISQSRLVLTEAFSMVNFSKIENVMIFVMPLVITSLFIWLQYQSYRMIIEKLVSLEFLGFIGLGFAIASSIYAAVESLIHQLYLPIYYRNINTSDTSQRLCAWNKMAQITFPLYLSATLLISALAPFLLTLLSSKTFSIAYIYVIFGAWIELFKSATNTLSSVAHSELQTKSLIKSYSVGAILAVSATLYCAYNNLELLIPGILSLSGFITFVIMYFDMRRLMDININILNIGKTLLYSTPLVLTLFLYNFSSSFLYSFFICSVFTLYILAVQYRNSQLLISELEVVL